MIEYEHAIEIGRPPQAVWGVLTDGARYPDWDPYCERIEGAIGPGARLKVYSTLSPGRAFPVRVTTFEPERAMIWTGGMPLGLFKGVRSFTLEPTGDSKGETDGAAGTAFVLREVFSGPMLALIGRSLPDMTEPFAAFANGLKARVEGAG